MKSAFSIVLAWLIASCLAQDRSTIDSLETVLTQSTGIDRYTTLHQLAAEYAGNDNESALALIEAEVAALVSGDSLAIVRSRRARGQILFLLGRTSEVISNNEAVLEVVRCNSFTDEFI